MVLSSVELEARHRVTGYPLHDERVFDKRMTARSFWKVCEV